MKKFALTLIVLVVINLPAFAQYFGRNKVVYGEFDFKVLQSPHFNVHYYIKDSLVMNDLAKMSERWYDRLSKALDHSFKEKKPIIFYANASDFQQTNITPGFIGLGTGGFTEGGKNRLVMPLTGLYASNDHVLGHEMVHEFQYDMAQSGLRDSVGSLERLPLWAIEGMAEYFSIGRRDPHTAMYLRDALLNNKFPTLEDLTRRPDKYFPYRYGEAFWAYIGGKYGDKMVPKIFKRSLLVGVERALDTLSGNSADSVSKSWKAAVEAEYRPLMEGRTLPKDAGKKILASDLHSGEFNLAPVLSPDGNYVAYLSEKSFVSIDLFLADVRTGKVVERLTSSGTDRHYEALNFISSSGSWSPDGKHFAFPVFAKGRNDILVFDMDEKKVHNQLTIPGINGISDPAWSPDGKKMVFSGLANGTTDLYLVDVNGSNLEKLTSDRYGDLQPVWSPDGTKIAFVTDRGVTDLGKLSYNPVQIAIYDVGTKEIKLLSIFKNAKHFNPQYSVDGKNLFFISDQDGFSDIYRINLESGEIFRITKLVTGVTGITELSPAMSVAIQTGEMMFSVFDDNKYSVYYRTAANTLGEPVVRDSIPGKDAGLLPPAVQQGTVLISDYLNKPSEGLPQSLNLRIAGYKPRLTLDFIGQSGGISVDRYGSYLGGDLLGFFSDILGNHRLGVAVQASNVRSFKDVGGQAFYQYLKKRIQYGGAVGHLPYVSTFAFIGQESSGNVYVGQLLQRIMFDQVLGLAAYPISMNRRFEVNAGFTRYSYELEMLKYYRDGTRDKVKLSAPDALNLFQSTFAYVGDYSFFGFTSPFKGSRYRLAIEPTFGTLQYYSALADYRQYVFYNPFTLAFRNFYYARYGPDEMTTRVQPLFLGYETMMRGYSNFNFESEECPEGDGSCPTFDRLVGSRINVTNLELRVPLFGVQNFGLINFPYLPTEILAFADGGLAWTSLQAPVLEFATTSHERIPVFSAGVATRMNIGNVLILQITEPLIPGW